MNSDAAINTNMLSWLAEYLPGGVIAINSHKKIILANRKAYSILGLKATEHPLTGRDLLAPVRAITPIGGAKLLLQSLKSGKVFSKKKIAYAGRNLLIDSAPIIDASGSIRGAAVYFVDVAEVEGKMDSIQGRLTKVERLNLVGQMAASVAHELRNPMTVIRGYMQYFVKKFGVQYHAALANVIEEVDRCNQIISDFLVLARNRNIPKARYNLNDSIREVWSVIVANAVCRGVKCRLQLAPTLPELLLNPDEIKQLILNLAINSLEAVDSGGELSISTYQDGQLVTMTVADTGCGIPADKLEYIFEPFYTTKTTGSGLGLPVCLSIVQGHGGTINVTSARGKGTTVTVRFNFSIGEEKQ